VLYDFPNQLTEFFSTSGLKITWLFTLTIEKSFSEFWQPTSAVGRDTPVTLHQDQRQLWGNARFSNRLKSDTVAVYFER